MWKDRLGVELIEQTASAFEKAHRYDSHFRHSVAGFNVAVAAAAIAAFDVVC